MPRLGCAVARMLAAMAIIVAGECSHANAQSNFFAGKTIRIIVGFPPGGGYNVYARAVGDHLGKHLPGRPSVVVTNMPGAGSMTLANYIYNIAPKDGTELGVPATFIPFEGVYKSKGVQFDPLKISWVGSADAEMTACVVYHTSKIKNLSDLFEHEATFGASGVGAPPVVQPKILNSVLGAKIKLVVGYSGAREIFLAMERGEVEGACGFGWSSIMTVRSDWVKDGRLRFLVQNAVERDHNLPETPLILDYAKDDAQRALFRLLAAPHRIDRPFIAPPDLLPGRLELLRKAFDETMRDSDFLALAQKLQININPVTGSEVQRIFAEVARTEPALIEEMIRARGDAEH